MLDCVAIVSGGMDSVTLLHYLVKKENRRPAVLTFRYGQKHDREIECALFQAAALNCQEHRILDLSLLSPLFASSALVSQQLTIPRLDEIAGDAQPPTYVPNRNLIFLSLAAAYAESSELADIYYGAQSHDMYGYWDTTPQFLERLNQLLQLNRQRPIRVHAPLINHSKTDVLRLGLSLQVDYGQTWSCYLGQDIACGQCPTCSERLKAFLNLGLTDPLPYAAA